MNKLLKIVILGNGGPETGMLEELIAKHAIVTCARDAPEALSILEGDGYDALFCAWSFHLGTWREALKEVHKRDPGLPVIVVYHAADEEAWVDVLDAGAFDLLAPPYNERLVQELLEHATESREASAMSMAGVA